MPDDASSGYSLVPVDHQLDFGYSLVPVDHDPFADEGPVQTAQAQHQPNQESPIRFAQTQPALTSSLPTQVQPQQPIESQIGLSQSTLTGDDQKNIISTLTATSPSRLGTNYSSSSRSNSADGSKDVRPVSYLEVPYNANIAFSELNSLKEQDDLNEEANQNNNILENQRRTINGDEKEPDPYISGVREGKIQRYPDGSMDVTNGTVVTLSYKTGQARTIDVKSGDIAHIDGKTGKVTLRSPL